MYRSQEIIKLFIQKNLPQDIIYYILHLERKLIFQRQIFQWIYFSELFYNEMSRKFFYNDIKNNFLNEIKEINGNMNYLKQYKLKIWNLKIKNKNDALYLNSLRY